VRGELTAFTGVIEVVRGLATMKDGMTLTDEIAINSAMGLTADDPSYVRRTHDNPLYNAAEDARAELLWALGKLTAYDALINNWDRLSVSLVWDNKGNFTNIVVEQDTLDLVGIDQCVYPIDPGRGLDTYRERLGAVVEYAYTLEASAFQCADLEALDSDQTAEGLARSIVEEESARERREQAQIMGKAQQEPAVRGAAMKGKHAWLQDLGKKFFIATGVLPKPSFLARHFVRGLADGFRAVSLGEDTQRQATLRRICGVVAEAFDQTPSRHIDLQANLEKCADFVAGNAAVIARRF
jgi:hypothetical protein